MFVLNVTGAPGSGKTWICHELQRLGMGDKVKCIDIDDYVIRVIREGLKDKTFSGKESVLPRVNQLLAEKIETYRKKNTNVVLVSVMPMYHGDSFIFLKIPTQELQKTYRRMLLRELKKITTNAHEIEKTIKSFPVHDVSTGVNLAAGLMASDIGLTFDDYVASYLAQENDMTNSQFPVMTQKQVMNKIKTMVKTSEKDHKKDKDKGKGKSKT